MRIDTRCALLRGVGVRGAHQDSAAVERKWSRPWLSGAHTPNSSRYWSARATGSQSGHSRSQMAASDLMLPSSGRMREHEVLVVGLD